MEPPPVFLTEDPAFFLSNVRSFINSTPQSSLPTRLNQLTTLLSRYCMVDDYVSPKIVFQALKDAGVIEVRGGRVIRHPAKYVNFSRYVPSYPPVVVLICERALSWVNSVRM